MELIGYVNSDPAQLDATFAALADPTRRAILARLASGEASVSELAEPFAMTQPAISKHLKVLERAGLVTRGRDAQRRPRRLEAKPLGEASGWLENYRQYWEQAFQRLDTLLEQLNSQKHAGTGNGVDLAASRSTHPKARKRQRSRSSAPARKPKGDQQ
jgi:DNA-binding transcriptional ArsR family regulator